MHMLKNYNICMANIGQLGDWVVSSLVGPISRYALDPGETLLCCLWTAVVRDVNKLFLK